MILYKEGEWILDKSDCLGYITNVHQNDQISARFIRTKHGSEMRRASILHLNEIRKAPIELYEESLHFIIDLSLEMKDKEWFKELTSKLPA
jgi:uncharacterized protein YpiB (UPF0302 family)